MSTLEMGTRELASGNLALWLDVASHGLSGIALAHMFYPKSSRKKRVLRGLAAGFLPDADFAGEIFSGGYITHRSATHEPWGASLLAASVASLDRLVSKESSFYKNAAFYATGAAAHLAIDAQPSTIKEKGTCAAISLGVWTAYWAVKKITSRINKSPQSPKALLEYARRQS